MLLFRDAFIEAVNSIQPMCVVHAAHAAEILLKARIAQEHPLLIFSEVPKPDPNKDTTLTLIDLLERGRTLSYAELPNQLWATTGIKIEQFAQYRDFGRLRNQIVHLSIANADRLDLLTLRYSLEVLDPLVESFWGKSVLDFITNDPHDHYASIISSGLLEDSIRKVFTIDQRLRRLLGETSKDGWERMQVHLKETDEFYKTKTNKDWDADYETWVESEANHVNDAQYKQELEYQANWKTFLDSF